ncbi:short-subunit dehydrogenase [Paenibacillus sp. JGP012]|uniref:SDR family NAD(P)-dependent oxidoreductase n=1 Tax=Paenibacillus sp. JGP012 TaxID=2735914 RepID=UPI00162246A7|nr:SDR family NAD(P)-dependent oxidoreductase [Paenibacillus sp. JGP012]MBB6023768.1 short-subunit dehydrogenase [Paenibacillus sp. JGP012]
MKTIMIIGAGKGLGLALAKRFGKEHFQVALVARNEKKLEEMVQELEAQGIQASYYVADIYKKTEIAAATNKIQETYGKIDVLEFSPTPGHFPPTPVSDLTEDNLRDTFEAYVISALNVVQSVLPDMLRRKEGAMLFTTGLSAMHSISVLGNIGIAMSGLRNYLGNLHNQLAPEGIFVAHRSLGVFIKEAGEGTVSDPDVIADMWFKAYSNRDTWEEEYPKGVRPEHLFFDTAEQK